MPPLRRRRKQLCFEQPVESQQRRVAREFVLDERGRRLGPVLLEYQREQGIEEIERRILRLIVAQHPDALCGVSLLSERIGKAIRGQRQEGWILRRDLLR